MNRGSGSAGALQRMAPLLAAAKSCEEMSRDVARRQASLAPTPPLARALRSQGRQEALHAAVFDAALRGVPSEAVCPPRLARLLDEYAARLHADLDAGALSASMFGLQFVFEGLAGVALQPPAGELCRLGERFMPLHGLVLQQELGHRRLGEVWMPRLLATAAPAEQRRLQAARRDYTALAEGVTDAALSAFDGSPVDRAHYLRSTGAYLASLHHGNTWFTDSAGTGVRGCP